MANPGPEGDKKRTFKMAPRDLLKSVDFKRISILFLLDCEMQALLLTQCFLLKDQITSFKVNSIQCTSHLFQGSEIQLNFGHL